MKTEKEKTRSFGGKIDNFTDKQERAFEKAHLKAYLKGDKLFRFGYFTNTLTGQRLPEYHNVKEVWK